MSIFELMIVVGFAILASYLMWIHYYLIHRDFSLDIFHAINESVKPVVEGLKSFFRDIQEEIITNSEKLRNEIESHNAILGVQKKLLEEQTNAMILFKQIMEEKDKEIAKLKKENTGLRRDLQKK